MRIIRQISRKYPQILMRLPWVVLYVLDGAASGAERDQRGEGTGF